MKCGERKEQEYIPRCRRACPERSRMGPRAAAGRAGDFDFRSPDDRGPQTAPVLRGLGWDHPISRFFMNPALDSRGIENKAGHPASSAGGAALRSPGRKPWVSRQKFISSLPQAGAQRSRAPIKNGQWWKRSGFSPRSLELCRTYGALFLLLTYPALTRWATYFRASGVWSLAGAGPARNGALSFG